MDNPRRRKGPIVLDRPARRTAAGSRPGEAPDRRPRADRARQVADLIRQQLLSVGFADDLLPDERVLSRQLGATRNAVREALDLLRQEGLVERLPGVGTVVVGRKVPHDLHRLMGLGEVLNEHGTVVNEVRTVGAVRPPLGVAHRLGLAEDSSVVYIERLRRLGGLPLSLDLTYITPEVGEPLLHADLQRHDIFQLIEQTKKDPRLSKLPVIIVTSVETREDKERGLALGAEAYILKRKFDHKGLLDTIRQIL